MISKYQIYISEKYFSILELEREFFIYKNILKVYLVMVRKVVRYNLLGEEKEKIVDTVLVAA